MTVQHTPPDVLVGAAALIGTQITWGTMETAIYAGVIGGAICAGVVMLGTLRQRLERFFVGLIVGWLAAPWAVDWTGMTEPKGAMLVSTCVSFAAYGLLWAWQEVGPTQVKKAIEAAGAAVRKMIQAWGKK